MKTKKIIKVLEAEKQRHVKSARECGYSKYDKNDDIDGLPAAALKAAIKKLKDYENLKEKYEILEKQWDEFEQRLFR